MDEERTESQKVREAAASLFSRAEGRELLRHLVQFCHVTSTDIAVAKDGHIDTHAMAMVSGRREVFQHLLLLAGLELEVKTKGEKYARRRKYAAADTPAAESSTGSTEYSHGSTLSINFDAVSVPKPDEPSPL